MQEDEVISYFAYGSNMSLKRLRSRVPGVELIGTFRLFGHLLKFHKAGRDHSAKCDAFCTGLQADSVYGVLFVIPSGEKYLLDQAEGLGNGYEQKKVELTGDKGEWRKAYTYYATNIDSSLRCYSWYKQHVLIGAREAGLPKNYLENISAVATVEDPDSQRAVAELSIYEQGKRT